MAGKANNPTSAAPNNFRLTTEQVAQFHHEGFLSPLTACTPEQMEEFRPRVEKVLQTNPPDRSEGSARPLAHNRHLDSGVVYELAASPPIIGAMASVLGDDMLLWRTHFFVKEPGEAEIPWHQDRNYWPLEPEVVVSAWLAIDDVTVENSCVQVIPGTHRQVLRHVKVEDKVHDSFKTMADTSDVDLTRKVDLELKPGQFALFTERTLHHSEPNRSDKRRIGMAIRVLPTLVRMLRQDSAGHNPILVSGEDRLRFNTLANPPKA